MTRFVAKRLAVAALLSILDSAAAEAPKLAPIRRLDSTTITTAEAESFAGKTLEAAHVTGAQIAVLDRGRLVWSAAFGLRRREPRLLMERETTTWAASITKSVFATYVMQLVERGEFSLDAPVAKQLPQPLDTYDAYRQTASAIVSDPVWPTVTPRMLLAHTSGLANFAFLEPDKKMRLHFKPGARYRYSGEGINLVQFVIEQQKGRLLDQLMQEALFTPLGVTRTGMIYRTEFAANVADRYDAGEQFLAQTKRFPARAAGSMTTSAEDLARFASALFDGKILKPATREAMLTPFRSDPLASPVRSQGERTGGRRSCRGWPGLWHGMESADKHALRARLLQRRTWRWGAKLHDLL